jgi:glycosyltransferase involved in cell wall biosynthesis
VTRFSVIVPVYNDPDGIQETLKSLLEVDYPKVDYEILVVDNGSTDGTRQVAQDIAEGNDHIQILIESAIQSSYAARNTGIEHAQGDYLVFIDADMTVERSWLSELEATINRTGAEYIGCNVEVYQPGEGTFVGNYNESLGFPIRKYIQDFSFAPTCCLVVGQSVVEDVGGFDSKLVSGGDREFGNRVKSAGYDQFFAEDIVMYHPARAEFKSIMKKAFRIGRGKEQLYQRYPRSSESRPWYHLFNVFPPDPVGFKDRLRSKDTRRSVVQYYLFDYLLKLVSFAGRVAQII